MDAQKLAKVLALAASDNDSEALHALRTAKRLLESQGADFVELARRVADPKGGTAEALEDAVFDLRNEVRRLRAENERLRQIGPGTLPPEAKPEPQGFQDAAREAAAGIRLRAELARMTEELEVARTEMLRLKSHEATMHDQFREALAEAGKLGVRLSEAESRRMRLEAENRRLSHANHALKVELDELLAQRHHAAAQLVAHEVRQELEGKKPRKTRSKLKDSAGQYALL
ncbi:Membrane protein related to metalloendopeptidase [Magnetospirillum sp. LM-5]|uniref:metalloendopeptidase n=1 Tax=Magnetospirillum sp. LM-5 TaxID=2681466 RepID=UPI00137DFA3E|nr:metalloendopeptidase [Magnetospirillum sp. LM-5]CAA7624798.1 Membrane protein related to metalloendopeptidase [Magnetospirillum sp. LM-5]